MRCAPTSWTVCGLRRSPTDRDATVATSASAFALFKAAGYELKGTQLTHVGTGRSLSFEILTTTRDQERLALAFVRSLKRAGIEARVRTVDATQFERRRIALIST